MITMRDIAREAGISRPTVSVILNGKSSSVRISEHTKKLVLETAERLGYRRNEIARSIKTGKTNVIGVAGSFECGYGSDIMRGIARFTSQNDYFVKFFHKDCGHNAETVARNCLGHRLDGVICRSWSEPELEILRAELEPFNIPVVLVDGSFPHEWCPRVISDDFTGAKLAVEHLHSLGHRRIAHVTNILTTNGFAKMRHDGYRAALREFGLDCGEELTLMIDSKNIFEDSFISSVESLCVNGGATAVFCGSDPIAMMVYRAASKAGLKIPEELSVAGYANLDYTAMMTPPLTTVAQPFVEMGSRAAEKLIMLIESGEECSGDEFLPVKLVVRESTARHMQRMRV